MIGMSVFDADAFSAVSLTKAVDYMSYVPSLLGSIPNLFERVPVRTEEVWIERRAYGPALIQTSPRGAPPSQVGGGGDKRDARAYKTVRLADASRVTANELQNIRRFGSEIDLKDLMEEVGRRQFKLTANFDLTEENLRLGCVQGVVYDADGSTVLANWISEFANNAPGGRTLTQPSVVPFNFSAGTLGSVRQNSNNVVRTLRRNLGGLDKPGVKIVAICGDSFYDQLVTHPEVRATYLNWTAAADLREGVGEVWQPFPFAGIEWINYRSTDDAATGTPTLGVPTANCAFFPRGAGIFQWATAPAEKFEFLNTPGQSRYSWIVRDPLRDAWADIEMYAYPLPVCVLPQALATGHAGNS